MRALGDGTLLATFSGTDGLFVRNLSVHLGEAADAGVPDGGPVPAGYYLVLKGRSRHGAPLAPYTLTATVEAGAQDLELEPNDDPEHATPLRESATGFLAPSGDQDWYRVHADAPAVLHAELSGADRADLELAVYAAAGTEKPRLLARANEGGPREPEVVPAVGIPAGDSYLLVKAAARQLDGKWVRDGEDRQTPYRLAVQLYVAPVSLGEGFTPLLPSRREKNIFIKDEGLNPTGSFKARGLCLAVTMAKAYGLM